MTPSKWRREGRESYCPGMDPLDGYRYSKTAWGFDSNFESFCDGWKEAEKAEAAEERAREEEDDKLRMCPWHEDGLCTGTWNGKEYSECREDYCAAKYWKELS
jgi:hypothetical protein